MRIRILVLAVAVVLAWPAPGAENVLRWASAIAGLTFDPHAFNHYPDQGAEHAGLRAPGRFRLGPQHQARSRRGLAPGNSTTWEFELRQGVRFHDVRRPTAEDVVFSLRRALSPESEFAAGSAAGRGRRGGG